MNKQTNKQPLGTSKKIILAFGLGFSALLLFVIVTAPTRPESTTINESSKEISMVGEKAPDFSLSDQNGNVVTLADYSGKSLIIFFTEGQMCYPSCWNQIASLGSNQKLNNDKVATVTVVTDTREMWDKPYQKMPEMLAETMLYDTTKKVANAYNVLYFPSSMHPGDLPGHTYVVIDANGFITNIKDDPQMGINDSWLEEKVNEL